jgi:hypothetical protein
VRRLLCWTGSLIACAAIALVGLHLPLASASAGGQCLDLTGSWIACGGSYVVQTPGTPAHAPPPVNPGAHDTDVTNSPPAPAPIYPYPAIGPNGVCSATGPNQGTPLNIQAFWAAGVVLPGCAPATAPAPVGAPAGNGPPVVDPAAISVAFWRTIPLPKPKPQLPPGYAVTGLPAYLVTGGTLHPAPYQANTPLGPLTIIATGSYSVDWGDGSSPAWTGPFREEGLPYPDGNIVHTFDNVGTVTITVVENWTATWTLGPDRGVLPDLQTRATIPNLQIRQLQAVITN